VNAERWDRIGQAVLDGRLSPANGESEWRRLAAEEARRVVGLMGEPWSVCEVGCGVGRLTPHLARSCGFVWATDTSRVMRMITRQATSGDANVHVTSPGREASCDVALVWGNLYDEDWSDLLAAAHLEGLLLRHSSILVQTDRPYLIGYCLGRTVMDGEGWFLAARDAGPPV
jgi:SAM-dependent methyltransferase